jgi:small-conductance mechanosensitive channel
MEQKDKLMKQIRGNEKSFERGEAKVKDKITKIDAKIKELENKPTKNQVKEVDKKTEIATLTNEKNELIAKLNGVTTLTQEITQLQEAQKQAFIYHQKSLEQQSKILNTLPIETAENKEGLSEARKALFISMQAHLDRLLL